jgi:hypothetical protein
LGILRIVLVLVTIAVGVILALFVTPGIHSDARVEAVQAVLAVVIFAVVFALIAWAMKPP